jgi:aminoglycoside phosphotransferase (APT) family kinase protein
MRTVHVKALRTAYHQFTRTSDLAELLTTLKALPAADDAFTRTGRESARPLTRDDLHLVCFDFVWS